jgi:hypothetical protein
VVDPRPARGPERCGWPWFGRRRCPLDVASRLAATIAGLATTDRSDGWVIGLYGLVVRVIYGLGVTIPRRS